MSEAMAKLLACNRVDPSRIRLSRASMGATKSAINPELERRCDWLDIQKWREVCSPVTMGNLPSSTTAKPSQSKLERKHNLHGDGLRPSPPRTALWQRGPICAEGRGLRRKERGAAQDVEECGAPRLRPRSRHGRAPRHG